MLEAVVVLTLTAEAAGGGFRGLCSMCVQTDKYLTDPAIPCPPPPTHTHRRVCTLRRPKSMAK